MTVATSTGSACRRAEGVRIETLKT